MEFKSNQNRVTFLKIKFHQAMKVQQQKFFENKMHVYVVRKDY